MNLDKYTKEEREDGVIILTPKKADADWEPAQGVTDYIIQGNGETVPSCEGKNGYFEHHNKFSTKDQAQKASKLQRVSNAIIRACLLVDPDYEPDWGVSDRKYRVYFNTDSGCWVQTCSRAHHEAIAHVSTREKARQVCALLTKWEITP